MTFRMPDIIDDNTDLRPLIDGDPDHCGGEQRYNMTKPRQIPYGQMECAVPFEALDIPLIPMEKWPEEIARQEAEQSSPWHFARRMNLPVWDQDGYGWCHGYSAVWEVQLSLAIQGNPFVELAPPSVAGPVTGWRNQGAWIAEDLKYMVKAGVASTLFVPVMPCRESECKTGWKEDALTRRVIEWWDLEPGNHLQQATMLFKGFPLANGRNSLSHAMVTVRIEDLKNGQPATSLRRYAFWDWNSWKKSYGREGCMVLTGNRGPCDEAYVARVVGPKT